MAKRLKVHSFQSLAALDGPGIRYCIFLSGCPLRCAYCHNPDTWNDETAKKYSISQITDRAIRYIPYFKENGGVTFSGGEPLLQAEALTEALKELKKRKIHTVIDTAGSIYNDSVRELLDERPMLLLDIKMPDEERYEKYIRGSMKNTLSVLEYADRAGCEIWLRYVVLPDINDSESDIKNLCAIANRYKNVKKISLLPYHTLGVHKYEALGLDYELKDLASPPPEHMEKLEGLVDINFKNKKEK